MIYYQHIGLNLWHRDGPKSIGTPSKGLKRFSWADIEGWLPNIPPTEVESVRDLVERHAPDGFQIWGLPRGAQRVIEPMKCGDVLLLLESDYFRYVGRVIHRFSSFIDGLSSHIWGEGKFGWITLSTGSLTSYPWSSFVADLDFAPTYDFAKLRGTTNRVAEKRLGESVFGSDNVFYDQIVERYGS